MNGTLAGLIAALAGLGVILVLGLAQIRRGGGIKGKVGAIRIETIPPIKIEVRTNLDIATRNRPGSEEALEPALKQLDRVVKVKPARILWVDDSPKSNVHEVVMLSGLGLAITQVTSSEVAEGLMKRIDFDLLITDLTRGGNEVAGLDLLRTLSQEMTAKIVYAFNLDARREVALKLGASAVTNTPGDLLRAVLDQVADRAE